MHTHFWLGKPSDNPIIQIWKFLQVHLFNRKIHYSSTSLLLLEKEEFLNYIVISNASTDYNKLYMSL